MNVHILLHIANCVRFWGRLWAYSAFSFENMNGQLKLLFHGTKNMSKQVSIQLYDCNHSLWVLPSLSLIHADGIFICDYAVFT